jgi:predicted lipid-binding transport protein (Tim44 family)
VLYTDALSAQEARDKGCRTIEGTPITVIQGRVPAGPRSASAPAAGNAAARPPDSRIDPQAQRARDSDSRRILEGELRRAEEQLDGLKREYNNGEPERLGNERNYQKYLDRTAELKSGVARKESDIAAIKRELTKLPP